MELVASTGYLISGAQYTVKTQGPLLKVIRILRLQQQRINPSMGLSGHWVLSEYMATLLGSSVSSAVCSLHYGEG